MRTKDIVKKVIPKTAFLKLKHYYLKYKKSRIPVLHEEEFRNILTEKLGVKKGSVVFIHSSTGNMNLGFPAYKMLSIILEVIGEEGTALFPCHQLTTKSTYALQNNIPFDVKKTPSDVGLLPELVRFHKKAVRSLHPTNSVVAIGKYADELTREHHLDIYPCGIHSPYYKITEYDGIILGLGVSIDVLTFVHTIEDIMKDNFPVFARDEEIYHGKIVNEYKEEIIVDTLIASVNLQHRNVGKFINKHISKEICSEIKINKVLYFQVKANSFLNNMIKLAKNNLTIYKKKVYKFK